MIFLYLAWLLLGRPLPSSALSSLPTSSPTSPSFPPHTRESPSPEEDPTSLSVISQAEDERKAQGWTGRWRYSDLVDTKTVDLRAQEYEEEEIDRVDDAKRQERLGGKLGWGWEVFYWVV